MKKYFIHFLLSAFIITSIFCFKSFVPISVKAQTISISQFVELLITIGAIPQEKISSARAMVTVLNQTGIATTTTSISTTTATTTTPLPYLQILSPNGGQTFEMDSDIQVSITWGSTHQVPVNISFVGTREAVCNLSPSPIMSKNTTNTFKVLLKTAKCFNLTTGTTSALTSGTYKARVSYTDSLGVVKKDDSDGTFKILPIPVPSIKVTYPNGGENLIRNNEYQIKYTLKDVTIDNSGLIYLYLLDSNGNIAYNSHKVARNGIYNFDIPSSVSAGGYKIKLKLTTNDRVEIEDTSDNFFWISTGL